MPRILWLKADRILEADAIVHPAPPEDVALAIELLEASAEERNRTSLHLRSMLNQQRSMPPESRKMILCYRPNGLMVLLPWRLAAWLVRVMESPGETLDDVRSQLSTWFADQTVGSQLGQGK